MENGQKKKTQEVRKFREKQGIQFYFILGPK